MRPIDMKLIASLCSLAFLTALSLAQVPTTDQSYVRIRVYHGDPWAIKALIDGHPISSPELSTILGFAGFPDQESELLQSIFGGQGRLVVNPNDNSLLFFPKKAEEPCPSNKGK